MTKFKTGGRGISPAGQRAKKETGLMKKRSKAARLVAVATAVYVATSAIVAVGVQAQSRPTVPLTSLKGVTVPEPPDLGDFVKDRAAAIALGKALFWDVQAGSDGLTACASCHFHAGADGRVKNVLDPNLTNMAGDPTNAMFNPMLSTNKAARITRCGPSTSRSTSCRTRPTASRSCCTIRTTSSDPPACTAPTTAARPPAPRPLRGRPTPCSRSAASRRGASNRATRRR